MIRGNTVGEYKDLAPFRKFKKLIISKVGQGQIYLQASCVQRLKYEPYPRRCHKGVKTVT